ncbi:AraC family transcriptional regulator [Streptomyces nigrescens]|uniref:AraC family transcriptional regulator n=1 Tax=Streptomyces nigrescens TaxID=1920 RepID=UPI0021C2EAAE|nr:AraC family transcriptional regulator [Streptomyces nigrescens]
MTADGSSSGPDEREIANATTAAPGRRRRQPAVTRPGTPAGRRHRAAADHAAAPHTAPTGAAPVRARTGAVGRADHHHLDLGPVRLSLLSPPAPPAVVELAGRYADGLPRTWHLVFATRGPVVLGRDQRLVRVESGSVVLWEPSECFRLSAGAPERPGRALVLHMPEAVLPLPGESLRAVSGRPTPTRSGPAALLASFVYGLAAQAPSREARHTAWLGTAAVNLATAFLDSQTALRHGETRPHPAGPVPTAPEPARSRTDLLLHDIKTYVEHHLHDADLSPASLAAAHHISLRYLHHLFQRDGLTVGGFLRERRLEHCRADLSDPAQSQRGAGQIARRWGFRDPAVFNRTFKSAYGVTPGAYRGQWLRR